jgi:hypothetical protein
MESTNTVNERMSADLAVIAANPEPSEAPTKFVFEKKRELVSSLNSMIAMVNFQGRTRYVRLSDPTLTLYSRHDMSAQMKRYRYSYSENQGKSFKQRDAFDVWLESPRCLTFQGIEFQPDLSKADPEALNLFKGFAVEPMPGGSYGKFEEHLRDNICGGDPELFEFVWQWCADLVQHPARKSGIALMLRGSEGVGKSLFSDVLARLIGERYCPVIDSPEQLVGRFSGQLEHALLLQVDEAFHAGNPATVGRLKSLVTGARIGIERKGVESYTAPSYFRIVMTSNSEHVVPVDSGQRRFLCLEVGSARAKDKVYFGDLLAELEAGGYAALMADLLAVDLASADFSKPPMTAALADQLRLSLKPEESWWASLLRTGMIAFTHPPEGVDGEILWSLDAPLKVERAHLLASFRQSATSYKGPQSPEALGRLLARFVPSGVQSVKLTLTHGRRPNAYVLPSRREALASFLAERPGLEIGPEADPVESEAEADPVMAAVLDYSEARRRRAA